MKAHKVNLFLLVVGAIVALLTVVMSAHYQPEEVSRTILTTNELPALELMNFHKIFSLLFAK